jgi:hypothetical protein
MDSSIRGFVRRKDGRNHALHRHLPTAEPWTVDTTSAGAPGRAIMVSISILLLPGASFS